MLWKKFKNVFTATVYLRKLVLNRQGAVGSVLDSSDDKSNSSSTKSIGNVNVHHDKLPSELDQFKDLATLLPNESQPIGMDTVTL